jgi:NET1-associated nuclear protein 1 (U3 small nucleolar RNA-associated protein 17)
MLRQKKRRGADDCRYVVNTQYPRPHGVVPVTSLAFSGASEGGARPVLLTAAQDGGVKTWHVRQTKKSEHGE